MEDSNEGIHCHEVMSVYRDENQGPEVKKTIYRHLAVASLFRSNTEVCKILNKSE